MQQQKKNILITWWAGFVWSNLCKRLLDHGHFIMCLDNLYTGSLENIREFINRFNDVTFVNYKNEHIFQMYMVVCIIKQLTGIDIPKDVQKCRILYMHISATPNIFLFPYVLSQLRYFRDNGDWDQESSWSITDYFMEKNTNLKYYT